MDVLQNMSREELRAALVRLDDKCRALAQERDAAVKAREEERAALNRAISLRDDRIQALCEVRDSAEAERDAARAEVERYRIALADLVSWQDAWPKMAQRLAQESHHMQDAVTAARAVLAGKDPDAALAAKGEA